MSSINPNKPATSNAPKQQKPKQQKPKEDIRYVLPENIYEATRYLVCFLKTECPPELEEAFNMGLVNDSIDVNKVINESIQEGLKELKRAAFYIARRQWYSIVDTANRIHDEAENKVRGNKANQSSSPSPFLM